jgi:hemerythrin
MSNDEVFFKWSQEYSVNIPTIDEQHQELVNMLNRLFIAVSKREGNKVIAGILDSLMDYTQTHFTLEERLMKEANYQDFEHHKLEHKKLIEQLEHLSKKYMIEDKPIYFEMLDFLRNWLKQHILGCDTKYSSALQKAGFSTTSWERQARVEFASMAAKKKPWWKPWQSA